MIKGKKTIFENILTLKRVGRTYLQLVNEKKLTLINGMKKGEEISANLLKLTLQTIKKN